MALTTAQIDLWIAEAAVNQQVTVDGVSRRTSSLADLKRLRADIAAEESATGTNSGFRLLKARQYSGGDS